ncbi:hypothetical protein C8N40_107134 [Pontibacter mucosus]|uniref:Uncharacterized protein n=1 Tax=Pontibacter mucosus TaxID=1649266 RepID=A0A2T5YFK3_9BACT|nr:hypothetical protein C8N40_107134 [Pontibacter mucosus]
MAGTFLPLQEVPAILFITQLILLYLQSINQRCFYGFCSSFGFRIISCSGMKYTTRGWV